jgi:hypothetical protein
VASSRPPSHHGSHSRGSPRQTARAANRTHEPRIESDKPERWPELRQSVAYREEVAVGAARVHVRAMLHDGLGEAAQRHAAQLGVLWRRVTRERRPRTPLASGLPLGRALSLGARHQPPRCMARERLMSLLTRAAAPRDLTRRHCWSVSAVLCSAMPIKRRLRCGVGRRRCARSVHTAPRRDLRIRRPPREQPRRRTVAAERRRAEGRCAAHVAP